MFRVIKSGNLRSFSAAIGFPLKSTFPVDVERRVVIHRHAQPESRRPVHFWVLRAVVAIALRRAVKSPKHPHRRNVARALSAVLVAGVGGAYVYNYEQVPITGRGHSVLVPRSAELEIATNAFANIKRKSAKAVLPSNHPSTKLIEAVGRRIVAQSGLHWLQELPWEFVVIDSPEANAFVFSSGKVVVFTGILPIMHDQDGVATVLSHEIGHVVARHQFERLSIMGLAYPLLFLAEAWTGLPIPDLVLTLAVELPHSRSTEYEADHIGLVLMGRACYDIAKAPLFWERMQAFNANAAQPHEYFSTHPAHENRSAQIRAWLPEAQQEKDAAHCAVVREGFQSMLRRMLTKSPFAISNSPRLASTLIDGSSTHASGLAGSADSGGSPGSTRHRTSAGSPTFVMN
eukprot:TRINITY_DN27465_c0_g1_i1.p1 TRINITY_DN27465_c0_g1~~TRINITY_DN27465_c0_g1_i1.p1  ORF type:complete len:402 (-),score=52.26 TRINITY_DN27465_c0_g1_i1:431-1636(-)